MTSNVLSVSHMRAAFINGFGGEDLFEFTTEFPVPNIKKDEVLIKVKCCAISNFDLIVRQGTDSLFERTNDPHGIVLGYEICGEVYRVGKEVAESKHFELGDQVVGFVPLDSNRGGYAEYTVVHYTNIVLKPLSVTPEQATSSLLGGLRAYTSLHYQLKLFAGESILICDGASGENFMALQLARVWGAKVFTTATTQDQVSFLQQNTRGLSKIVYLDGNTSLVNEIMEETGGLGVDAILDNLGSTRKQGYTKKDLEQVLGVFGKWTTTDSSLQLDPPESKKMYIKNNSLSFVFEHSWLLSSTQIGRYLHILKELMQKLDNQEIKSPKTTTFPLEKIKEAHIYQQTKNVNGERVVINI